MRLLFTGISLRFITMLHRKNIMILISNSCNYARLRYKRLWFFLFSFAVQPNGTVCRNLVGLFGSVVGPRAGLFISSKSNKMWKVSLKLLTLQLLSWRETYWFQNFLVFIAACFGRHFLFLDFQNDGKVSGQQNGCPNRRQRNRSWRHPIPCGNTLFRKLDFSDNSGHCKHHRQIHWRRVRSMIIWKKFQKMFSAWQHINFSTCCTIKILSRRLTCSKYPMKPVLPILRKYFFEDGFSSRRSAFRSIQGVPFSLLLTKWGLCLNFNLEPQEKLLYTDR